MQPLFTALGTSGIVMVNGATSLPFPPLVRGANVSQWSNAQTGKTVPEFDIELWADGSITMTAAELFGGSLKLGTIADDDFTVDHTTEIVTAASHGLHTGDGPVQLTNAGGALPAGLATSTNYWIIKLSDNTFYFAASLADALAGTAVAMTGNGTGTHTLVDVPGTTKLMHMHSCGLLGNAADGAITLTSRRGYNIRVSHRPNIVMYWISASFTGTVYADIYPAQS